MSNNKNTIARKIRGPDLLRRAAYQFLVEESRRHCASFALPGTLLTSAVAWFAIEWTPELWFSEDGTEPPLPIQTIVPSSVVSPRSGTSPSISMGLTTVSTNLRCRTNYSFSALDDQLFPPDQANVHSSLVVRGRPLIGIAVQSAQPNAAMGRLMSDYLPPAAIGGGWWPMTKTAW